MPDHHHVPSEIVADILSRLPVKPLLQFRCVSKPWCALIDSPDFIKTHLNRSIQTKTNLSLILRDSFDPNLYSIDFDSLDKSFNLNHFNLNHPLKSHNHNTRVWGSCNGLLCLSNSEEDVVLWNPSTKRHWKLPFAPIEATTPGSGSYIGKTVVYGFGFDQIRDDYKVVRIVQLLQNADDAYIHSEVRVYSLKSNSWKRVRDFPSYLALGRMYGLLVNGDLHWDVTEKSVHDDPPRYIVGFNLWMERFHLLHHPEYNKYPNFHYAMGVLDGSLCVICCYYPVGIDLWVMKGYGVNQSWTKLISMEHSNVISSIDESVPTAYPNVVTSIDELLPVAYSKNGRKVLLLHNCHRFLWYDLDKKTIEEVWVRNRPDEFGVIVCLGSLVPLGDGGGVSDGKKPAAQDERNKMINTSKRDAFLSEGFKLKL